MDNLRSLDGWLVTIVGGLIVAAITGAVIWLWRWNRDRRDMNRIYAFMTSDAGIEKTFRSKERIASDTNLAPERVITLCAKLCQQGKLRRNQKQKDAWRLS